MPPPMQSVARPVFASIFCISWSRVTRIRQPDAPTGWPRAMAPPLGFNFSRSKPSSFPTATDWAANASLASITSKSPISIPAFAITFFVAATGPMPMIRGSTPARAPATHVAMGVTPSSFAFSSLITTTAAAPSLMPEALPAVTIPSFLNAGRSFPRASILEPALGPSSVSTRMVVFFVFTSTGTISSLNAPAFWAASHLFWLTMANLSSSSLVSPHWSQIFSAVIPMW